MILTKIKPIEVRLLKFKLLVSIFIILILFMFLSTSAFAQTEKESDQSELGISIIPKMSVYPYILILPGIELGYKIPWLFDGKLEANIGAYKPILGHASIFPIGVDYYISNKDMFHYYVGLGGMIGFSESMEYTLDPLTPGNNEPPIKKNYNSLEYICTWWSRCKYFFQFGFKY